MSRFLGVKSNYISIVSDKKFSSDILQIIELPKELEHLSSEELIVNCKVINGKIKYKNVKKDLKDIKIALVSNYKMMCGISTYAENLYPEIVKHIPNFKLFIEENAYPTGDISVGDTKLPSDKFSICWKRGEPLTKLVEEIKSYDPDIILIQHEWGLFPNAGHWLAFMTQLSDFKVFVTMHSVYPNHKDKIICEAAIPNIIVHLEGAKFNLKQEKNISSNVDIIGHGCYPLDKEKIYNNYKSNHTILQMGFGFQYKNFEATIEAASLLKNKYDDLFLTLLFSESPYNKAGHQLYYNSLVDMINNYNLQNHVAIIRNFQSDVVIKSFLKTNKVAVFPYMSNPEHEVFGASGAARLAMANNMPVITSSINHFSDLPTIKANNAADIAKEIDKLFSDYKLVDAQLKKQSTFIEANMWDNVAKNYIKVFCKN